LVTAAVMTAAITVNWATFTSSDRAAGGVGSAGEVQDRLNTLATSIWAIERKPLLGWGIGRFTSVNTYHHQQWSPTTPWERGFGISSHFDIVGIAVELGVVGLILWVGILYLVIRRVAEAVRRLPETGVYNRPLAWTALMCLLALVTTGLTVDLRFFDFCNIVVWLLAGAAVERSELVELQPDDRERQGTPAPARVPSGAGA
jgi:O-antigen ligase